MKHELIGGNGRKILQPGRLEWREMSGADFPLLCKMLQDIEGEHAFGDNGVQDWIEHNMMRYRKDGCSYYLAFECKSGICIGQPKAVKRGIFLGKPYLNWLDTGKILRQGVC